MTTSHLLKLQLLTASALVVLAAACGAADGTSAPEPPPPATEQPEPSPMLTPSLAPEDVCDPSTSSGTGTEGRYRAWVLFRVDDPRAAAAGISNPDKNGLTLLAEGGDNYVIVRADVVEGNEEFNLVVPVDAADKEQFSKACGRLSDVVGQSPETVLRVLEHFPAPPHRSSTFITESELSGYYLEEYDPPGRHPKSPGANPWG